MAYVYFTKNEVPRVREVAPHHALYWRETGSAERGGPFSDRSGGLIIFAAAEEGDADGWSPTTRSSAKRCWNSGG